MTYGTRGRPLRILCLRKSPLQFQWEKALHDAVYQVDPSVQVERVGEQHSLQANTDVYVILYGAEHHETTIDKVMQAAVKCRAANPAACVYIVACDYSIRSVRVEDVAGAASKAGLDDPLEIEICHEVSRLRAWFIESLEFTLSALRRRSYSVALPDILDEDPQREGLDGEGGPWLASMF